MRIFFFPSSKAARLLAHRRELSGSTRVEAAQVLDHPEGTAARSGDRLGVGSGRLGGGRGHDGFELDRGQSAEACLAASAVVGAFDPGDDRDAELVAGGPALPVEDVLLQQREERFHGGVVAGGADLAHRADHAVAGEGALRFRDRNCDPRSECRMQPATSPRRATALSSAATARRAFIRDVDRVADDPVRVHVFDGAEVELAFVGPVLGDVGRATTGSGPPR